jgi:hypothetical protein
MQLSLSDHLSRFVKGIPNGSEITIKQMLDMTSGIYDFTNDATFLAAYQANPQMPFSLGRLLAIIHRHKPSFAPGTSVEYSDSNYWLLGVIAEKLTHRSLARVIRTASSIPCTCEPQAIPRRPECRRHSLTDISATVRAATTGCPIADTRQPDRGPPDRWWSVKAAATRA